MLEVREAGGRMSGEEVEMQGGTAWKGDQRMGEEEGK